MIDLVNVTKVYPPNQPALKGIDLKLGSGELLFIAGASGAGKSTLLRLLFGAERATSGQVLINGRNLSALDKKGIAEYRREVGIVFQDYKLLTRRSVIDNVAFGLEVSGVSWRERRRRALLLLHALGLGERAEALPQTLSGGEQQRVAIARALIHKPKLLIADEPTGNLDHKMSRFVFDLLADANRAGVTVIIATHNLALVEEQGLRTLVLDRGTVLGNFSGSEVPRA